MVEKKTTTKKEIDIKDFTICDATQQMLEKARRDGVETAFDRAANMKACPIGQIQPAVSIVPWGPAGSMPGIPTARSASAVPPSIRFKREILPVWWQAVPLPIPIMAWPWSIFSVRWSPAHQRVQDQGCRQTESSRPIHWH
jgi:hypothetical protein